MRCEEVRPLLPELAEGIPRAAGEVELHLAGCADCSAELARYRTLILELGQLRQEVLEPASGLLGRILDQIPESERASFLERLGTDRRMRHAMLSLGGVVVGATAIGLLWWRANRRALTAAARTEESA